ncbi:hypothetical protein [Terriglobus roseus]|uniref:Uncharacterized protein n=1 Tax=Terriglobus roseus TaxID=392734 RepID=A0A1G7GU23_9BACT|nr:hypothetical protein [Terriglobus roseus]SDE91647.1 hypothetical protein SAMN05444167_0803 [Terriglobus roseus]
MSYSASDLLNLSDSELDDAFKGGTVGPIPNGEADGRAILAPGTKFTHDIASIVNIFAWQGKTFDAKHGTLTNRISSLGVNAIVAQVYVGPSLFDGKDCIILDYSKTSLLAKHVRDEIRLIAPQLYLGLVYWDTKRTIHFSLQFPAA